MPLAGRPPRSLVDEATKGVEVDRSLGDLGIKVADSAW